RAAVAPHSSGRREFAEERPHSRQILSHFRMHLRIGPFEITLGDKSRPAVAGTRNINDAGAFFLDEAIQMHVNKILARRCAPMSQEARLDMLGLERLLQELVIF